jgi:hypothetical protein
MNAYTDHGPAAEQEAGDGLAEGRRQSVAGVAVLKGSIILSPFCRQFLDALLVAGGRAPIDQTPKIGRLKDLPGLRPKAATKAWNGYWKSRQRDIRWRKH